MKKVITYEAPDVTVFEIHPEGALCESGIYGDQGRAGAVGVYVEEDGNVNY